MARKPSAPRPSRRSRAASTRARKPPAEVGAPDERYGPVALARSVKDDGRALILYRRSDDRQP